MQFLGLLPSWEEIFRGLMAILCRFIYTIISGLYDLFINVSKVNILSNGTVKPIYERVTLILTIIMVFYVTFEFIKYIIQPDTISDKEKGAGNIVIKMIAVVILIAFVPMVFTNAMKLQNVIIDQNIIGKMILGQKGYVDENFGGEFSASILSMFYSVNEGYEDKDCDGIPCAALVGMNLKSLKENGHLKYFSTGINSSTTETIEVVGEKSNVTTPYINFDGLFAVIVGGFIAYILLLYCVDVGVRWAQLIYLQVIAPIPIIGFLSPKKDGIFQKWCKQCITTYLDLFIRTAIIYFVLMLSSILLDATKNEELFSNLGNINELMKTFVIIVLVLGLLLFAKKAPKMLGELFPSTGAASGNFGLKPGERGLGRLLGGALGTAAGAGFGLATGVAQGIRRAKAIDGPKWKKALHGAFGGAMGAVRGTVGGTVRGLYNGTKKGNPIKNTISGAKNQVKSNRRFGDAQENGYGIVDKTGDRIISAFGLQSRIEVLESEKDPIKRQTAMYEKIKKANDDMRARAEKKVREGKGQFAGELLLAEKTVENIKDNQDYKNNVRKNKANSAEYLQKCKEIEQDPKYQTTEAKLDAMETLLNNMTDEQMQIDLQQAERAKKIAKDKAINDFLTNNGSKDSIIKNLRAELMNELEQYNKNEDDDNKISRVLVEAIEDAVVDGAKLDALIGGDEVKDEYGNVIINYGNVGISDAITANNNKIVAINSKQDAIKRQTAGSEKTGNK